MKILFVSQAKEHLCVPVLLTLRFAPRAAWFVISNTRLQHWRALHAQLLLVFWNSDSATGCKTPLLTFYGFGSFQYTEGNFFLVNLYVALSVLLWFHRHVCAALHQGARVCAKVGVLMTQKFLLKTIIFIFPARQASVPVWNLPFTRLRLTLMQDLWCLVFVLEI